MFCKGTVLCPQGLREHRSLCPAGPRVSSPPLAWMKKGTGGRLGCSLQGPHTCQCHYLLVLRLPSNANSWTRTYNTSCTLHICCLFMSLLVSFFSFQD